MLPQQKADIVEKLQRQGRRVCFIGDGINDSIALKKADVSISMAGATSIAKDMAEIIFMDGNISNLGKLFNISKELNRSLKNSLLLCLAPTLTNISGAFVFNFSILTSLITNTAVTAVGVINVSPYGGNKSTEKLLARYEHEKNNRPQKVGD